MEKKVEHKCPKCGTIMRKLELQPMETSEKKPRVYDLGRGYSGASGVKVDPEKILKTTSTMLGSSVVTTATIDPSYPPDTWEEVALVPYECTNPDCRHRKNFRR